MRFLLLALLLGPLCHAQELLDRPIGGRTGDEILSNLSAVFKALPDKDASAFAHGVTGLTVEVRSWRRERVKDEEHTKFLSVVVRDMTPRQIIVLGSMLRSMLLQKECAEDRAAGRAGVAAKEEVAAIYERQATDFLARYDRKG